jgi:ADP-ribosyl-[dinitrogen reductase] hydrolase
LEVADLGRGYVAWWRGDGFDTGPTAAKVLALAASGITFEGAAVFVDQEAGGPTAGCNPAHRNVPLARRASLPDSEIGPAADAEAWTTHRHPLAGDVAAISKRR